MNRKYKICPTDVSAENLPKFSRDRSINRGQVEVPYTDERFEEYEDLLMYFPKTHHSIQELKVFRTDEHSFDKLMKEKMRVFKNFEKEHSLIVKRMYLKDTIMEVKECLKKQWEELIGKEEEFTNFLMTFQEFLKESGERFERLRTEIEANRTVRKAREEQIDHFKEKNRRLKKMIEDMGKDLERTVACENFLMSVVSCRSSHFDNVDQILHHFEILMQRRNILAQRFNGTWSDVSDSICKMHRSKGVTTDIKALNMTVYKLKERYGAAKKKASENHNFYVETSEKLRQKRQEFLECKDAIFSIYTMMSKDLPEKETLSKDDFMGQLRYMSKVMNNLEQIGKRMRSTFGGVLHRRER